VADGKSRAAARVAIHFGKDDAGDAEALVEFAGRLNGILPGHGVGHEEYLDWVELLFELLQLAHEVFVDVQASGGIDKDHVAAGLEAFAPGAARQFEGVCSSGAPS